MKGHDTENSSGEDEDYSLVNELGLGPSSWIAGGYMTNQQVDR